MESETKRAAYFTEAELEVLMHSYEEYKHIFKKKSNTVASMKERQLAWQEITDRVNACNATGARRTLSQVRMKHKNILQQANKKKAEARCTGGGPPPPPLTPAEELALSLNKGGPVVDGIPGGTSSQCASHDTSDMVMFSGGSIILLDPPETNQCVTVGEDEEAASAVTEQDNAGRPTETLPELPIEDHPSTSTAELSSLSAKELYRVHLLRQIKKSDMEMDLLQLQMEEKRIAIHKATLEVELLEHHLEEITRE